VKQSNQAVSKEPLGGESISTLNARLAQRERELSLLLEMDRIRDQTVDETRLLTRTTEVLVRALDIDLCFIGLTDAESGEIRLKSVSDRLQLLSKVEAARVHELLEQARGLDKMTVLTAHETLAAQGVANVLSVPLVIQEDGLGAIVLASCERTFGPDDLDVVNAVVSQTDSAIVHARSVRRLKERNLELETLYRLDRIRDQTVDVTRLLTQATEVIVQALNVDLCLMGLTDAESGEIELKSVSDRMQLLSRVEAVRIHELLEQARGLDKMTVLTAHETLAAQGVATVLSVPLVIQEDRLGAIVLACRDRGFGAEELDVLNAVVSQTDSAIVHARSERRLKERNLELETLYRVDRIRDLGLDFDEMLSAVLAELCAVIEAEIGFIMLFDAEGRQLELRASTDDDIVTSVGHQHLIEQAANHALRSGELYVAQGVSEWLRSIMCVPLILREQIIGVFGAVNRRGSARGFLAEDRRLLLAITSQVDTAIFESLDKQRIRATFRRYVGPKVMERMLAMPERDFLKGDRAELTALFSDMRGFTRVSEWIPADVLVEMLNSHLGAMTEIVLSYDGTLDKFVADQVVAILGAPLHFPDHALRAVQAAVDMQAAHKELIAYWAQRGYPLPPMGIGISTGEMVVGNIGCEMQLDYTVIGAEVNLASRLCDVAAADQILISANTYKQVSEHVRARKTPALSLDGIPQPVRAYEVLAVDNTKRPESL
jgi:class 3 adenylate cyclase